MVEYRRRIADVLLSEKLEAMGAVLIEGPKYCGKTTTALQHAKSVLFMADPEKKDQNITLVTTNIGKLLSGDAPRLIDEWQIAPKLWDAVRFEVDKRGEDGQFILTGSAVPPSNDDIFHTGTGRFSWLTMRTMSLWESGDSSGEVSLSELFKDSSVVDGTSSIDINKLAFLICRGGWPQATQKKTDKAALMQAKEYYKAVTRSDISRVDDVTRDSQRAERLMRSYARLQGAQATVGTILADIKVNDEDTLNENTIYSYINALKKIFVIEDVPAWNPNLRSKTAIRTSDTRYFTDPSIATASLGLGPEELLDDLETMGLMFETLCIRDLRVYADAIDGTVYHYRDKSGLECDAVIHKRNGTYGLVEIKLGGDANINDGAKNLLRLSEKIDTDRMKKPSFMMILTGVGDYAYRRTDDVLVVPIGCLKD
ncbi:MAG: DUF4143 domain-containing protein [Bacteroidales bacterium]|nr:DUF4143 domain-containing protein [Bacteroidales bacterium]